MGRNPDARIVDRSVPVAVVQIGCVASTLLATESAVEREARPANHLSFPPFCDCTLARLHIAESHNARLRQHVRKARTYKKLSGIFEFLEVFR